MGLGSVRHLIRYNGIKQSMRRDPQHGWLLTASCACAGQKGHAPKHGVSLRSHGERTHEGMPKLSAA
eukprot:366106-Chlamydomonas_euryale.AAC.7